MITQLKLIGSYNFLNFGYQRIDTIKSLVVLEIFNFLKYVTTRIETSLGVFGRLIKD
ncbi:hypothetical protein NARC_80124 [Candidatus Nitrosocosmicus arcticus]|uniref:Uncharacterized protein n=1 Tax=Candidatus Nitrosocosmicus arcticus TaxID=2035267 RepID=A0A557SUV6_9ARCH|nr:hypothetical protein NARC_80124 [Candidatus Nitrosocosmicus arcticus]